MKEFKDNFDLSAKIRNFILPRNSATKEELVIFLASCFLKFRFIQITYLYSDNKIKEISCMRFGKAGKTENLKINSERTILPDDYFRKRERTTFTKGFTSLHSINK